MTTPNRIALKTAGRHDEGKAAAALKPGHVLMVTAAATSPLTVQKYNLYGTRREYLIALEDGLQGKTTADAYATGDIVQIGLGDPGDEFLLRVPASAAAIVRGDPLIMNGDGCVVKAAGLSRPFYSNTAVSAAAGTSSNTIQAFDKTFTLPANFLKAGDSVRVRAQARYTATNSTDTGIFTLKIGSTTLAATPAVDVANDDIAVIDVTLTCLTVGASGTFLVSGTVGNGTGGTATMRPVSVNSTTIDTTAAQTVTPYITFSASSSGNAAVLNQLVCEVSRVEEIFAIAREALDNSAGTDEAFLRARLAA